MPKAYQNFDIEAFDYTENAEGARFSVRVSDSPAGQQPPSHAEQVALPPDLGRRLRRLESRSLNLEETIDLGQDLAKLLLPGQVRQFMSNSRFSLKTGEGLRIRLRLDSYALSDLPWEYIYLPGPDTPPEQRGPEGFLVLDRRVSLVRYELMAKKSERLDPVGAGPLRLVALMANPRDSRYAELNLEAERRNIEAVMSEVSGIEARFFPGGRVLDLEDALRTGAHIFHYAGHGQFVGQMGAKFGSHEGKGALVLVAEDGGAELFPVDKLAPNLVGRDIRLAVFSACETARRDQYNAWTGVAPALTRAGIPAVVAMQYNVRDANAIAFSRRFYGALAAGETLDAAVTDGRLAIFNRSRLEERDWGVPVLYLRTRGGSLLPSGEPELAARFEERAGTQPKTRQSKPSKRAPDVDKRALRGVMLSSFDLDELEALCWDAAGLLEDDGIDLSVNLDMVGGGSKTAIVMNLIDYFDRRGYLAYLVRAVRSARPGQI